jgi:hypothetical protein
MALGSYTRDAHPGGVFLYVHMLSSCSESGESPFINLKKNHHSLPLGLARFTSLVRSWRWSSRPLELARHVSPHSVAGYINPSLVPSILFLQSTFFSLLSKKASI